jgi:hypothetical protein
MCWPHILLLLQSGTPMQRQRKIGSDMVLGEVEHGEEHLSESSLVVTVFVEV